MDILPQYSNDLNRHNSTIGQYRATQLWNDLIKSFRNGIEVGRHRRHLKLYDNTFVAQDAVQWLHNQLQHNPNFGDGVTRSQTVKLLKKFHKAHVFEDVRGSKHNKEEFTDSSRLFRFTTSTSPEKVSGLRVPLATRNIDPRQGVDNHGFSSSTSMKKTVTSLPSVTSLTPTDDGVSLCSDYTAVSAAPAKVRVTSEVNMADREEPVKKESEKGVEGLARSVVDAVWKDFTLAEFRSLLFFEELECDVSGVRGQNLMHNMTYLNKNGVVNNIPTGEQLPSWVLSAMRVLAYWPERTEDGLPKYDGFEADVFKVVRDYFSTSDRLVPGELQQLFTAAAARCEAIYEEEAPLDTTMVGMTSFQSVENLLSDLTSSSHDTPASTDSHVTRGSGPVPRLPGYRRQRSTTRLETSFGVENNTPHTRQYTGRAAHRLPRPQSAVPLPSRDYSDVTRWRSAANLSSGGDYKTPDQRANYGLTLAVASSPRKRSPGSVDTSRDDGVLIFNDPDYVTPPKATPAESGYTSDSSSGSARPAAPPPYIPPPAYPVNSYQRGLGIRRLPSPEQRLSRDQLTTGLYFPQRYRTTSTKVMTSSVSATVLPGHQLSRDLPRLGAARSTPALNQPRMRSSVAESYRLALDSSACAQRTPQGKSLFSQQPQDAETLSMEERLTRALCLCCMTLSPSRRRKLHLLLRLMYKVASNSRLDVGASNNRQLVIDTFAPCIFDCSVDLDLARHLVTFMMDHYSQIMRVPAALRTRIHEQLDKVKTEVTEQVELMTSPPSMVQYCSKVSLEEYETQKTALSDAALDALLTRYLGDENMGERERRRKLKQFQKAHPDVYAKRFPSEKGDKKPKLRRKQTIISKPLQKFRNLRM